MSLKNQSRLLPLAFQEVVNMCYMQEYCYRVDPYQVANCDMHIVYTLYL